MAIESPGLTPDYNSTVPLSAPGFSSGIAPRVELSGNFTPQNWQSQTTSWSNEWVGISTSLAGTSEEFRQGLSSELSDLPLMQDESWEFYSAPQDTLGLIRDVSALSEPSLNSLTESFNTHSDSEVYNPGDALASELFGVPAHEIPNLESYLTKFAPSLGAQDWKALAWNLGEDFVDFALEGINNNFEQMANKILQFGSENPITRALRDFTPEQKSQFIDGMAMAKFEMESEKALLEALPAAERFGLFSTRDWQKHVAGMNDLDQLDFKQQVHSYLKGDSDTAPIEGVSKDTLTRARLGIALNDINNASNPIPNIETIEQLIEEEDYDLGHEGEFGIEDLETFERPELGDDGEILNFGELNERSNMSLDELERMGIIKVVNDLGEDAGIINIPELLARAQYSDINLTDLEERALLRVLDRIDDNDDHELRMQILEVIMRSALKIENVPYEGKKGLMHLAEKARENIAYFSEFSERLLKKRKKNKSRQRKEQMQEAKAEFAKKHPDEDKNLLSDFIEMLSLLSVETFLKLVSKFSKSPDELDHSEP